MPEQDEKEFFSRWSRRKQEARKAKGGTPEINERSDKTADAEQPDPDTDALAAKNAELKANRQAAEEVDLETLDEKSDFSIFMKDGVPEALRRRAMMALWRSNPLFANIDGLVDYDDDFANPDLVMKTFESAWQAGQGYLKPVLEQNAETGAKEAASYQEIGETADAQEAIEGTPAENPDAKLSGELKSTEATLTEGMQDPYMAAEAEAQPAPRVSLRKRLMLNRTD